MSIDQELVKSSGNVAVEETPAIPERSRSRLSFLSAIPMMPGHDENADFRDLNHAREILPLRDKALTAAMAGLGKVHPELTKDELFALASTDVFVEKAQAVLTRRSSQMYWAGVAAIFGTGLILGFAVWQATRVLKAAPDSSIGWPAVTVRLFQATTFAAFVLIAVKLLVSLGRSFFHEGLSLLERRHAMRFGRLYVYLAKGKVDLKKLEAAFHWNKETQTSFLDMKPEVVAETLLHRLFGDVSRVPPALVRAVAGSIRRARRKKRLPVVDG